MAKPNDKGRFYLKKDGGILYTDSAAMRDYAIAEAGWTQITQREYSALKKKIKPSKIVKYRHPQRANLKGKR